MGHRDEALARLRQRMAGDQMPWVAPLYLGSLLAILEDRRAEAVRMTREAFDHVFTGAEETVYLARQLIRVGELDDGLGRLKDAVDLGFSCPRWLVADEWFEPARQHPEFASLLTRVEAAHEEAIGEFSAAGGDHVLGRAPAG